jgi:hypothetical protein
VQENQSRYFAKTGNTTGVDIGIANGKMIDNPNYLRKADGG